ncbi:T-complex protein 1 subunit gamma [Coemansia sp. RSA 2523]|nr:T-complex protein 1 subunit gamma [Coemansia sp. RSA 2523]KAJ2147325.1 T-complex protein 1 subunit gamma [Coemansia sp. RSA 564]KAJ2169433.1 T-complex protein 1 subunit gamma [Coemansia sp. RSA 562]KAJ2176466.1 T-complex protein 1 subunit gamma [Coemansia sp. RSA 560]KAJ2191787.1 T-complex protein 1 subunit gamma [Coemansia sp. RSA 532]KAJ2200176.1 T-complex protein 1 subunit gamma [Coemansia sp. RSA 530]KAJ2201765.1 T-complex protein 1 subunit gamma [Coemansia sp. RSA 522]KAJ2209316.1 T-
MSQSSVIVVNTNKERESGHKAQMSNIAAGKTVADVVRTSLGPRAMLKMLLDPMGGITLTNDGFAILRECEVAHPAAKSMIELSRTQDDEVGDGTTSVIILAGELLAISAPFLERKIHPVVILRGFQRALEDAQDILRSIAVPVDTSDREQMLGLIKSAIGTKFVSRWNDLMCGLALDAVQTVVRRKADMEEAPVVDIANIDAKKPQGDAAATGSAAAATADAVDVSGKTSETDVHEVDIKRFARVEKVPGGEIEESRVLDGVMINKDVVHPKMRRRIENPRIVLLDCPLEYKKGESQTNIEITREEDWARILEIEEEQIKAMCEKIAALKPDLVVTEKGVSDLAQHFLVKNNITALRRMRKTDNNRIARATGARIVTSVDELKEQDVGTDCGLFSVDKIGDEYFTFLTQCRNPKACTILLRGPGKDTLNEIDRNLQDAMCVARNVLFSPYLCPGGGATEMALAVQLGQRARSSIDGVEQWPYGGVAEAMEVIPRTLIQNGGGNAIRTLTELRAKHAAGLSTWGVNGETGTPVDMKEYGVWEPLAVKLQTIKTAVDSASLLLRVDDIVSATGKKQ